MKSVQDALNQLGYKGSNGKKLKVDGSFGKNTKAALKNFQKANGLKITGKADEATKKKIAAQIKSSKAQKSITQSEKKIATLNKKIASEKAKQQKANKNINIINNGAKAKQNLAKDKKAVAQTAKAYKATGGKTLSATQLAAQQARKKAADEQLKTIGTAKKYIKTTRNADGTLNIGIDDAKLKADKNAGKISQKMYEGIKKYYDDLVEQNKELSQLYEEQTTSLTELYDTLKDLKEQYANRSEELLNSYESFRQKEVDSIQKLNDSLSNTLKKLLDEVKKRLDQRRKQEDNKQKEDDISRKQQRLAALRADTAGGHQVEIKQLEKEIAEAQQSYGRELEDQRFVSQNNQHLLMFLHYIQVLLNILRLHYFYDML